jgi:hypothetical protein
MSTGAAVDRAGADPAAFVFGQQRLVKCFVIELGMKRVRCA